MPRCSNGELEPRREPRSDALRPVDHVPSKDGHPRNSEAALDPLSIAAQVLHEQPGLTTGGLKLAELPAPRLPCLLIPPYGFRPLPANQCCLAQPRQRPVRIAVRLLYRLQF